MCLCLIFFCFELLWPSPLTFWASMWLDLLQFPLRTSVPNFTFGNLRFLSCEPTWGRWSDRLHCIECFLGFMNFQVSAVTTERFLMLHSCNFTAKDLLLWRMQWFLLFKKFNVSDTWRTYSILQLIFPAFSTTGILNPVQFWHLKTTKFSVSCQDCDRLTLWKANLFGSDR